ncbi:MAG: UDP-N-acetylmuramoyl-L-alanyl-D-glutamate--2,6-diaminopimelate ligase [Myxococcota bacterium]
MSLRARFEAAHRALTTAAVTGTNGKTTTVSMIEAVVRASGEPSARLTTLGAWVCGQKVEGTNPTEEFLHCVEAAVRAEVRTLALEMTSKALAAGIARRWPPRVGVFTNLSRDHLDMHGGPEAYLAAKAQLFVSLRHGGTAVLNADDPSSALLADVMPPEVGILRYATSGAADLRTTSVDVAVDGTRVAFAPSELGASLGELRLRVHGDVHAQNAMACALAMHALGYAPSHIREGLEAFRTVAGRFEVIATQPVVVVDYAHTPDGLRGTLRTARQLAGSRLICVFGCGGERDQGKRPQMGAIAHVGADRVIVTSDNPRREDPEAIIAAIESGAKGEGASWERVVDRRAAVERALSFATADDVVVIAGKGHETTQEIGDEVLPFSDAAVVREIVSPSDLVSA